MFVTRNTNHRNTRCAIFLAAITFIAAIFFGTQAKASSGSPTTTTLTLSAPSVTAGTAVTLTASVSNGSALTVGTITFCDATAVRCLNTAVIGTAQLTLAGTATLKFIPAIGSHSYNAMFSPSNANLASTSAAQALTVTGLYSSATSISSLGSSGNYTLQGMVVGTGSTTLSPAGGSLSFVDTSNANTIIASGALGASTLAKSLAGQVTYGVGGGPILAAAGDFNGDGKMDLAVANNSDNTVTILIGNGDGTFMAGVPYAAGAGPVSVAAGDLNSDGKLDLVVTDSSSNTISILLGNGDGTFQAAAPYAVGSNPEYAVIADFNGDGVLDLAVANGNDATLSVLLGHGDGTFQPQDVYATGTGPVWLVAGDFNGDGFIDLAVANQETTTVSVLLGVGDGTFQPQAVYTVGTHPSSIAMGDFNGDGKLDLAVTNLADGTISVLIGVGDGTFLPKVTYAVGNFPAAAVIGDFDGDGNIDLAVPNASDNTVSVLLGVGDGTFLPQVLYATGAFPVGVVVADFNGDGLPDLIVTNDDDNTVSVLLDLITQTSTFTASGVSISGSGAAHAVDASYAGDTNFAPGVSSTIQLTPSSVSTSLVLTANPTSSVYGQSVMLSAQLNPSTSGSNTTTGETVTFMNGATALGTGTVSNLGVAALTLATLPAGIDSLTAVYAGDANFLGNTSAAVSFVVSRAVLTVTANNVNRAYDAANPVFAAVFSGFVNGDLLANAVTGAPTLSTSALTTSPAGAYVILAQIGNLASANYSFALVNGTLTVTPAVLTVTANNAGKIYGAANPTFTPAFSGFLNGDTQASLTGAPSFTTPATATSSVGAFAIAPAIGTLASTNYTFAFVNGTLNITQAVLTVTANNSSRAFGAANPGLTAAFAGFVNGDSASSAVTGTPTITTTAITTSPVGSYPITIAAGTLASTNYSFTFVNGTLSVGLTAPVITWTNPASITFGTALSATQLNATASVAGTFVYAPAAGTIPTAGSDMLSVTFTPTDTADFSTAAASATLIVNKATPVITWLTPVPFIHGTALSAAQLNATASVGGTFVYNPMLGTIPAAGSDVLSVTFTPTDAIDNNTATGTVILSVLDVALTSSASTQTITAGQTATFTVLVAPVGSTTIANAVTFSITGLPPGATFSSVPATVPAGSAATSVALMIQTTAQSSAPNSRPRPLTPLNEMFLLSSALFLLMIATQFFRNRAKLTPQLLVIMLLASPCLAVIAGISGCGSASAGQPFSMIVTETSAGQTHSINVMLVIQK